MDEIVKAIKKRYWRTLSKKANVHGFSGVLQPRIRNGKEYQNELCFRIYVKKKYPIEKFKKPSRLKSLFRIRELTTKDLLPESLSFKNVTAPLYKEDSYSILIERIPIDVVELPEAKYCSLLPTKPEDHRMRFRPSPSGVSCTHEKSSACTLNYFYRKKNKDSFLGYPTYTILMALNNHCGGLENKAKEGDYWLAPSPYDKGTEKDRIAKYSFNIPTKYNYFTCPYRNFFKRIKKFVTKEDNINYVDIAFGIPLNLDDITFMIYGFTERIRNKGIHEKGKIITKSGRTSGISSGPIEDICWCGNVQGNRGSAWYEDSVLVKAKVSGGDSGSPIYDLEGNFYGALFAGTSDENHLIYCKIENIERLSDVELITL